MTTRLSIFLLVTTTPQFLAHSTEIFPGHSAIVPDIPATTRALYSNIDETIASIRADNDAISLIGYSINGNDEVCSLGSDGQRILKKKKDNPVDPFSRWHVGSCTKSMTAALMAILIEEGSLGDGTINWDSMLKDAVPQSLFDMTSNSSPYAQTTLKQLLGMQTCIPRDPDEGWWQYEESGKSLMEQRADAARDALQSTPAGEVGEQDCYSNWAYVLAGAIMEAETGTLWEQLVGEKIFQPLGFDDFDVNRSFGVPDGRSDPWGHFLSDEEILPCPPDNAVCDNPAVGGPAGTFSGETKQMMAYLAWHVRCHNGKDDTILSQESCRMLHTPVNVEVSQYALGLVCVPRPWAGDELACNHVGSNNLWLFNMWIAPGIDRAFVGATNEAGPQSFTMTDQTMGFLIVNSQECEPLKGGLTTPKCENDDEWFFRNSKGKKHNCRWVAKKPTKQRKRCNKKGRTASVVGRVKASEACPVACGTCED